MSPARLRLRPVDGLLGRASEPAGLLTTRRRSRGAALTFAGGQGAAEAHRARAAREPLRAGHLELGTHMKDAGARGAGCGGAE